MGTAEKKSEKMTVVYSLVQCELSPSKIGDLKAVINFWGSGFPKEETWVQRELGVPSLFVRLDVIIKSSLFIDDIIGNPLGVGLMKEIHPGFHKVITGCQWPLFRALKRITSNEENKDDDSFWVPSISEQEAINSKGLLVLRNGYGGSDRFVNRSVTTVGKNYRLSSLNLGSERDFIDPPIFKLFFLYNLPEKEYKYAGGFWKKVVDDKIEIGLVG